MVRIPDVTVSIGRDPRSRNLVVSLDGGPLQDRVSLSPKLDSVGERELNTALLWEQVSMLIRHSKIFPAANANWTAQNGRINRELSLIEVNLEGSRSIDGHQTDYLRYWLEIDYLNRTLRLKKEENSDTGDCVSIGHRYQVALMQEIQRRISEISLYQRLIPASSIDAESNEVILSNLKEVELTAAVMLELINNYGHERTYYLLTLLADRQG